jgi:TonB family protein
MPAAFNARDERADDLMRRSALNVAVNADASLVCAGCRSAAMPTRSVTEQQTTPPERAIAVSTAGIPSTIAQKNADSAAEGYQPGEGYKSDAELGAEPDILADFLTSVGGPKIENWVSVKNVRNLIFIGFFLMFIAPSMCSTFFNSSDNEPTNNPTDVPPDTVSEMPPDSVVETATVAQPKPLPAGNPGSWIGTSQYPAKALREEREGTTAFRLEVDASGGVTSCTITSSSGHSDLDRAACAALQRNGRFDPARDATGEAMPGMWSNRVRWQIPR